MRSPKVTKKEMSRKKPKEDRIYAGIVGLGMHLPPKVMTNKDMEKIVDTSDEWITTKLGIKRRRFVDKDTALSDIGIKAAKRALKDAGIKPEEIDAVIVSALSLDYGGGAMTSNIIKDRIGAKRAFGIDMTAICAGFVYSVEVASALIQSGKYSTILVINGETFSKYPQSRVTSVIFGDGAGAFVMKKVRKGYGVISSYIQSTSEGSLDLGITIGGSRNPLTLEDLKNGKFVIQMEGQNIYRFVQKAFPDAVTNALRKAGLSIKDVDFVIAHQANLNLIKEGMRSLGLPMSKTYTNIHKYGNIGGGSVTLALKEAVEKRLIKKGDIVVTVAYGAGLTWGANVIRWG